MQLLAADGLGRLGRPAEGAALLATAVKANLDPPLELMAEASRVAGRLTAVDDPDAARSHFQRAARIFESVGNVTARGEVERDVAETLGTVAIPMLSTADAAPLTLREDGQPHRPPAAALTERIAAIVELGAHAPLLAAEACSLLADTGAAVDAAVVATQSSGQRELVAASAASTTISSTDDHPAAIRIDAGAHRDRLYSVVAVPHGTASARATLLAVERLVHTAVSLARARQNEREQAALWPDHTPEQELGLLCVSERMLELIKMIRRVASAPYAVLITGETGVGKELFARALHLASPRRERVFMPFNCTAASRDMMDSQLFGHRRGAFTGATEDGPGVIRAAAGGTLFLDEIGEMSPDVQPKLLRFLESGEILPLGETRPQLVDVRVVAATNANLDQLVADGRFREDLYFRLNVIPIPIPPLRERREEIPALVGHFLERFGKEMQKPGLRVADETLEYLLLHRWPGNVRQLANELRRIVALAEPGATIMPAHLGRDIIASRRTVPVEPTEIVMRLDQTLADATEQIERAVIERALAACGGRNDETAKRLGLSRKGLYLKKQRLGIKD